MPANVTPPLISILIPTYNRREILAQTLQSVLDQGAPLARTEIIISNDASKDTTAQALAEFKALHPHLVISIFNHTSNLGGPGNWRFLLEQARGQFVFLLSDDDWIAPTFLKNYIEIIESQPEVDLIYSAFDYRDENMQPLAVSPVSSLPGLQTGLLRVFNQLKANHMVMSSMYRTATLRAAGGWQAQYGTCLDGAAFALTAVHSRQTYFINKPLFIFRVGSQSWSSFKVEKQKPLYIWFRKIIADVILVVHKKFPHAEMNFKRCYGAHAQGVLNMLDIKMMHGNLRRIDLLRLLKDLLRVFPETLFLKSFYKMLLVAFFGSGWLILLRKILNKPDIRGTSVFEINLAPKGEK